MNELARWDPFQSVVPFGESLFDVVPTLLRPVTRAAAWSRARMDVAESEKSYQLAIELPGIPKDSIQVSVYENTVTITGEAAAPQEEAGSWLLRERSYGKLTRNIQLPEAVDDTASEAKYADGVLYLTLQKKRASQIKRLTVH